ncbi:MAG: 3-methyladenine DNA glycosylase Tag [Gammaproteobacteria bacterium]|jgi:3-methyladenine DNA glycosylase Tag
MRNFDDIFELAANRKGGSRELEKLLGKPKSTARLRKIPDDRWLSAIVRSVFQAGFVWRIVEHKWPDFEDIFCNFDLHHVAYLADESIESLLEETRIIRHRTKLLATRDNAAFLLDLASEHGSAANYFANYPATEYVELLLDLKKRGSRLGGTSAQYFLRTMGKESFILSRDVVRALMREKIVDRAPNSQRDLRATQDAFNIWCAQGKRSLTEVSRILAMGIES